MLSVSGLPVSNNDELPDCGGLTVLNLKERGLVFGTMLSASDTTKELLTQWDQSGLSKSQRDVELLAIPMVLVHALSYFIVPTETSPLKDAYAMFQGHMLDFLKMKDISPSNFEELVFGQLAIRSAVAQLWATIRSVPTVVPAFHLFGTELVPCLFNTEFQRGLPCPSASSTSKVWSVPTTKGSKQPDQVVSLISQVSLNLGETPFLVKCSLNKSSFDIMMSMSHPSGDFYVFIDCAYSVDSGKSMSYQSKPAAMLRKVKNLSKVTWLSAKSPAARLVPFVVTNQVITSQVRSLCAQHGILIVDRDRLATFFSPTISPLLLPLPGL